MKYIFALAIFFTNWLTVKAQISPSQNNEYCPDTEYTFTATISKSFQSITGVGGCYVTVQPSTPVGTTFTFKGKFDDVNKMQTFRIYHPDNTWTDFDFKRIKSLFYGTCAQIIPSPSSVTAARCEIVNIPISFTNAQWTTAFESPQLCFGTITTYEYQLPAGWSIGSTVSTGSNWIADDNNVTVTSDLSSGIGSSIKVRAVNSGCGTGLTPGAVTSIPIYRPAPLLYVDGPDNICSGTETYSVGNLPAGATVVWSLSNGNASIVGCSTCSSVDVSKNSGDNTVVLSATVSHCTFTYTAVTKTIYLGFPYFSTLISGPDTAYANSYYTYTFNLPVSYPAASYDWRVPSGWSIVFGQGTNSIYVLTGTAGGPVELDVTACGLTRLTHIYTEIGSGGWIPDFVNPNDEKDKRTVKVMPNPAHDNFTVTLITNGKLSDKSFSIQQVTIADKMGSIKKQVKYGNGQLSQQINISGLPPDVYVVSVFDGKTWYKAKLLVQ